MKTGQTTVSATRGRKRPRAGALPPERRAGVCLHITSLPGPFGIGELGQSARDFIDFVSDAGIKVWQFLPTGPTAYGDSPYQPLSSFAGNEMLIDIEILRRAGLLSRSELSSLEALPDDTVDYGALIPAKNALLAQAASRFKAQASAAMQSAYREFLKIHDAAWLHDYALFRLLKSLHDERPWQDWEPACRDRHDDALLAIRNEHAAELEITKTIQFFFYAQWHVLKLHARLRGVWLFGDMPIYIALDSTDAWVNREILQLDDDGMPSQVAGVPPDYFSEDGQLWGNPLYDWDFHDQHGYAWWVGRVRHAAAMMDLIRIDHFRGFEAYWSIPANEKTAKNGQWIAGPGDRLFNALERELGFLPIVAEDLGVITPEVEALRDRHRIPGMVVLQFELDNEDFRIEEIRENCVCYTGTHDNDTTRGWFLGSRDDTRTDEEKTRAARRVLELTKGSADTIHLDMIRLAINSKARLAIAPMQDYLGLDSSARFNTPGKPGNNWRWRLDPERMTAALREDLRVLMRAGKRQAGR